MFILHPLLRFSLATVVHAVFEFPNYENHFDVATGVSLNYDAWSSSFPFVTNINDTSQSPDFRNLLDAAAALDH